MTRFATVLRSRAIDAVPDEGTVPAKSPSAGEDVQDRIGAQGSFNARQPTAAADSWTELAMIVTRLIKNPDRAVPVMALDRLRPTQSLKTSSKATASGDDNKAATTGALPTVPVASASAPSNDPQLHVLTSVEPAPPPGSIDVPKFPEPKHRSIASGGGGGSVAARPKGGKPGGAAAQATPAADATSENIVEQWQGSVNRGATRVKVPEVAVPGDAAADLDAKKKGARDRNAKAREGLADDAVKNVPKKPDVDKNPPPPPPSNPIPEHTERILRESGKHLDDQIPPPLEESPAIEDKSEPFEIKKALPTIGEQAVPADLFQVLLSPDAQKIAQLPAADTKDAKDNKGAKDAKGPATKEDPEARRVRLALMQLSNAGEVKVPKTEGEQIIDADTGPEPMPPLPAGLEIPVGNVVARLLARAEQTSQAVLDELRVRAYADGILKKHFPDAGEGMIGELSKQVNTELRDIAGAANITAGQLETMIGEQRRELEIGATAAALEADTKGTQAVDVAKEEGQKTMDAVAAAAKAAEEETLRRQEAAGGSSDPTVVNRRKDMTVSWIREHVTTQTTNYQLAGEKRVQQLNNVKKQQTEAYKALAQRLIYRIMTPSSVDPGRKPRDTGDAGREKRLADHSVKVGEWEVKILLQVSEIFRKSIKFSDDAAKANRKAVEGAGNAGIEAARQWAEDKILAGKSWWDRFIARIQRWLSEADSLNEEWRVRRTRENRDAVRHDLQEFEAAKGMLKGFVDEAAIDADQKLNEAQKAVLKEAFRAGNPLEFAASRLKKTIATSHLSAARAIFERELVAKPATKENAEKLNEIAQAMGDSNFNGDKIATECHAAMDQWGTDEGRIFSNLKGLTAFKGMVVRKYFASHGWGDLDAELDSELSGDEYRRAQAQIDGKQAAGDAIGLHDAIAGMGTDEKAIMELLRNKTPEEVEAIRSEYLARYGETLDAALKGDLDKGNEIDQATALLNGDTATADAIAFDDAMRGGIVSSGTDEAEIEKVQTRVREEVLARAQTEKWSSQRMEAEVRHRMKAIEDKFGERYADVEQYNEPGLPGGSVLKRAFASELSGPDLDLANALQDNDLIKADAARVEIERTGFYASDDKLLKVMRSQYERALEARRLDEGPARQMRVQREVEKLRSQTNPKLSEEQISHQKMALEHKMEKEIDKAAASDAEVSTEALRGAYEGKYNRNFAYTLSFNMSGREHDTALALLKNGGKLTPLQEVELATRGDGTEEDVLRKTLRTMTKAEIAELRREWEARHPGKRFDEMVRGELSGRDESDIMDMVEHGAPESAMEQIAQETRRVERERNDLTGIVGGVAASSEDDWMQFQVKRLSELETDLNRTDWPPGEDGRRQREALMNKVDFRVQRVQDSVEDHRRKIDSVTDSLSQAASIIAAVVVGAIVTVLTAGTMGPAVVVALVALSASLAGTIATMATKRLVMGGAYGAEDFGVDLAVGVVDAAVSVATAGMGDKLLKVAKGVVGKLPIARIGAIVAKPMAALGTRAAASPLARVGTSIAESNLAAKAMKTPFVGGALKSFGQSAKGVGKVLTNPKEMEEAAARFLATSADNMIQGVPSTFTQVGLSDDTWKGDSFANFVDGMKGGLWQSFYMGHLLSSPMHHASNTLVHGFGHIDTNLRMKTEMGQIQVAGKMVQEGFTDYRVANPGASVGDFLASPKGRKVRAEIEAKGLLPTVETVAKKLSADPTVKAKAEAAESGGPGAAKAQAELRVAQLEAALPDALRDKALVSPDAILAGNTVRVEPLRIGNRIVGVDIRVGPDATPMDIAMHAGTVHAMRQYTGIAGRARQALENMANFIVGSDVRVGKRGWEARLEMGKLPAIIDARLKALEGQMVTPGHAAHLQADIDSLSTQFHEHETIFHDAALSAKEGRGFVAAEDKRSAELSSIVERIDASKDLTRLRDRINSRAAEAFGHEVQMRQAIEQGDHATATAQEVLRDKVLGVAKSMGAKLADKLKISPQKLSEALVHRAREKIAALTKPVELTAAEQQSLQRERERNAERSRELDRLFERREDRERILRDLAEEVETDRNTMPQGEYADRIFNERMDHIIELGKIATNRAALEKRLTASLARTVPQGATTFQGNFNRLKKDSFNLPRKQVDELRDRLWDILKHPDAAVREQMARKVFDDFDAALRDKGTYLSDADLLIAMKWLLDDRRNPLNGRRWGAKDLVDMTRRPPNGAPPLLEQFVLQSQVEANAAAMARLKEHLAETKPNIVFGVREGGALLTEGLAPRPGDPHHGAKIEFRPVDKGPKNSRTFVMEAQILDAIRDGKTKFAIFDSLMGGTARTQFIEMIERIMKLPESRGVKFDLLWIREGVGFERNLRPDQLGVQDWDGQMATALPPQLRDGFEHWHMWEPLEPIPPHLQAQITEKFEHVRFIIGDDMRPAYDPSATASVIVFDSQGRIVAIIRPGVADPITGERLNTTREIVVALLNGSRFWK